jgi:glutamate racemase
MIYNQYPVVFDMRIGFMDSGLGGIAVLRTAAEVLPSAEYVYFADTGNAPYGTKTYAKVHELVFCAADFLVNMNINALVIACNTATSVAVADLRLKYDIPIVGMEPAVKPAVTCLNNEKRVLVLATPLTLKEQKFKNLVSKVDMKHVVDILPAPGLVELAENMEFEGENVENYLKTIFADIDLKEYSFLVLGCTHFLFFRNILKNFLSSDIGLIDGNDGTVRHLINVLVNKYGANSVDMCKSGIFKADSIKFFDTKGTLTNGRLPDDKLSDCTINDCTIKDCTINDCTINDCTINDCTIKDCILMDESKKAKYVSLLSGICLKR